MVLDNITLTHKTGVSTRVGDVNTSAPISFSQVHSIDDMTVHEDNLEEDKDGLDLQKQLDANKRKLQNAINYSKAFERCSQEEKRKAQALEKSVYETEISLKITTEQFNAVQQSLEIDRLKQFCLENGVKKMNIENKIREIVSDPLLNIPLNTDKRSKLERMKSSLLKLTKSLSVREKSLNKLLHIQEVNESLRNAASNGDKAKVQDLLLPSISHELGKEKSEGIGINIPDKMGMSAFLYACGNGHASVVNFMLESSASLAPDIDGKFSKMKPLLIAVKRNHKDVVRLLLESSLNLETEDGSGKTALLIACENRSLDIVAMLLEKGSDVNHHNRRKNSCLHILCHNVVEWERDNIGDIGKKNEHNILYEIIQLVLDWGADPNLPDSDGITPLQLASLKRCSNLIHMFQHYG